LEEILAAPQPVSSPSEIQWIAAADFNWIRKAEIEDGVRSSVIDVESSDLREARKRIKLLEQENEVGVLIHAARLRR
jgi:hypothetical protein